MNRDTAHPTYLTTLQDFRTDLACRESPVTHWVVLLICLVFLTQEIAAITLNSSILGVTSYLFLEYPMIAWPLSFFLHKGVNHFFANIILIGFCGHLAESSFSKRSYLTFLVGAIVLTILAAYAVKAPFTSQPIAVYGASGFGFAIAAYSLSYIFTGQGHPLKALIPQNIHSNVVLSERIAALLGVSAIITAVVDVVTGPYLTVHWFNGAHVAGAFLGILVAALSS